MSPAIALTRRQLLAGAAAVRLPRRIHVGLIGLDGHTGEVTKPLPELPDVQLTAVSDAKPASVKRFTAGKETRGYADWRQMLDKEQFDVVGVCNENSNHAPAILACLERNIHVIAEKPMATDFEQLKKVRAAVEKGPARFTTMMPMRFTGPYLALHDIVVSGEVGEVIQVDGQKSYKVSNRPEWYYKRSTYGGTMAWIGIHMIDLMLFCSRRDFTEAFGYQNHIGFPDTGETENVTATVFRLDNGGVALLRMDYLRPGKAATHGDDRLRLAGTKGVVEYQPSVGVTIMSEKRDTTIKDLPAERSLFSEFLDHIYNGKAAPIPWRDIVRGHEVVLGARDAMESGKIRKL